MNNEQYLELSEKTEKKMDEGLTINKNDMVRLDVILKELSNMAAVLDDLKKHYIYGAELKDYLKELTYGTKVFLY
jgi:coproporphyrinogen III oxidase-like Fe-S oxidoreductase